MKNGSDSVGGYACSLPSCIGSYTIHAGSPSLDNPGNFVATEPRNVAGMDAVIAGMQSVAFWYSPKTATDVCKYS
jgi:hypothetical protein